jgi:hypothetical protein
MQFQVNAQPPDPAVIIKQRHFVVSSTQTIGTTGMFNCMGVVIHSPALSKGAVAHIEAEGVSDYLATVELFIERMIADGGLGPAGTLEIAFFGNSGKVANMLPMLNRLGFANPSITDCRSGDASSRMSQVAPPPAQLGGVTGNCFYVPSTGTVFIPPMVSTVTPAKAKSGTEITRLQDADDSSATVTKTDCCPCVVM